MIREGDPVTLDGVQMADERVDLLDVDVRCIDLGRGLNAAWLAPLAAFAGGTLLHQVEPQTGPKWDRDEDEPRLAAMWAYADGIEDYLHALNLRVLRAAAQRDLALAYHRDRRASHPDTVLNVITFFSRGCEGGELVIEHGDYDIEGPTEEDRMHDIGRVGFTPEHLRVVAFDGQRLHGVAPFTLGDGGYRLSLTFYLGDA